VSATLVDIEEKVRSGVRDVPTLNAFLMRFIGEPFLFARFGYGDEFSMHFGLSREAKHPKLRASGIKYGSYFIRTRGSGWLIKSSIGRIAFEGVREQVNPAILAAGGTPISPQDIKLDDFLSTDSFVMDIYTCFVKQVNGIGFRVDMSDNSSVLVIPTADEPLPENSPDLPELSDWELETPYGMVRVGPGLKWKYLPTKV
jgi:hypothetical protein